MMPRSGARRTAARTHAPFAARFLGFALTTLALVGVPVGRSPPLRPEQSHPRRRRRPRSPRPAA